MREVGFGDVEFTEHAGVVDQCIEGAQLSIEAFEHLCHLCGIARVALQRNRLTAVGLDLRDHFARRLLAAVIVDADFVARAAGHLCDLGPYAAAGTGDKHDRLLHSGGSSTGLTARVWTWLPVK